MPLDTPLLTADNLTDDDRRILAELAKTKTGQKTAIKTVRAGRFVDLPGGETEEQRFVRIMNTPAAWVR